VGTPKYYDLEDYKYYSSILWSPMREIRGSTVNGRASTDGRLSLTRGRLRPVTAHASPRRVVLGASKLPACLRETSIPKRIRRALGRTRKITPGPDHRETHSVARRDTSCSELHNNFLLRVYSSEFCNYSGVTGSSKTSGLNAAAKTNPIVSLKGLGLFARPILSQ
jgi:hypothetical protein